jgi:hydroxypyruvate reductase
MITDVDANRFTTHSLKDPRVLRILCAALDAVDPAEAVRRHLPRVEGNVYGLGIGKASIPMLTALANAYPLSGALAISKHASTLNPNLFPIILGNHPIPGLDSVRAGKAALDFVSQLHQDDTLICLISGGGSALVTAPLVPLDDLQSITSTLLSCGATINEINTIRRELDQIKGGGLARATKAGIVSLILSDVIGNPLEAIASGMTAPNPTSVDDVWHILEKYQLQDRIPIATHQFLKATATPSNAEDGGWSGRVQNIIIGDNKLAAQAALAQAKQEGFTAEILTNEMQGEAREMGAMLAQRLRAEISKRPRPFCLIAGGETTVTLHGTGKGGRNQELALAAVDELRGLDNVMLVALATDGDDGPTDAAGAVVTGESAGRAERLGVDATGHLSRNDAYPSFEKLEDLIKTGPTGTNVNDLVFLLAL